jgi:WD40 repeat protein
VGSHFGNGLTQIWDLSSKQLVKTYHEYGYTPVEFVLSPNEQTAAITGRNKQTQILDVSSGQILYTLNGGSPLAFSPDGETIAYTEGNDSLVFVDVKSGESLPIPALTCSEITALAYSPDGDRLAFGGKSCDLQIRDARTGKLVKNLMKGNEYGLYAQMTFSPDGDLLILSGTRLKILDVQTGTVFHDADYIYGPKITAISPDGRYLAISGFGGYSEKGMIQIRDVTSNQTALLINTLQEDIKKIAFAPDARTLMIVGESIEFWDLWDGRPLVNVELTDSPPIGVELARDGRNLILVDERGSLQRWAFQPDPQFALGTQPTPTFMPTLTATPDIAIVELVQIAEVGKGTGSRVRYSPDGTIAALIENETLKWFDSKSLQELGSMEIEGLTGWVQISPNNKFAVAEAYIGAQIIDLEMKHVQGKVFGGNGFSSGYTFSSDSQYMAYTIGDRTTGGPYHGIGLWNLATGDNAFSDYDHFRTLLEERYHTMSAPAISPDVKLVAAGHSDKRIYVWDLLTGNTHFLLDGHGGEVNSVDFSPNGRWLASGSDDGTVRLWNPSNGQLLRVITGFTDDVWRVRFSPDSRSLQVLLSDRREYLVNLSSFRITPLPDEVETPSPLEYLQYQQGYSTGSSSIFSEVLFSPDGKTLATASQNVLLWDVSSQKLLAFLSNPAGGVLRGMDFNAAGSLLAAVTSSEHILVWDTRSGELIFSQKSSFLSGASVFWGSGDTELGLARSRSAIAEQGIAFSPVGNVIAFGHNHVIEIWDVENVEKIAEFTNPRGSYATQMSFSSDGKRLYAVINRNRTVRIWDVSSGRMLHQVNLGKVDANAFSAVALNGHIFARNNVDAQGNGVIELWDLEQGSFKPISAGSTSNEPLVLSSNGELLVAYGENNTMSVWKTSIGVLVYQTQFQFSTGGISISPDTRYLAVGSNGKAHIFDLAPIVQLANQPGSQVVTPQSTPTPMTLAWPTLTPVPVSIETPDPASASSVIGPGNAHMVQEKNKFGQGTIDRITWSPDGDSFMVSGSIGMAEYVVNLLDGSISARMERELSGRTSDSKKLPDGRILSVNVDSDRVRVWDVAAGKILVDLEGGGEPALSPNGSMLVYLNSDLVLDVWDVLNNRSVAKLESYSHYSLHPVFSPDGRQVAAVQHPWLPLKYADSIRIWDSKTGEIMNALAGPDHHITRISFSADGTLMIGAAGGSAWVWSLHPGAAPEAFELYQSEINYNLNIYTHTVSAAAISPDNRVFAIGTSEHTLTLYDRRTKVVLHELDGHSSSIQELRFSPNGRTLISVDQDGTLIIWDISSGKRLAGLSAHTGPTKGMVYLSDRGLLAWGEGTTWKIDPFDAALLHSTKIESNGSILAASPAGDLLAAYEPFSVSLLDARNGSFIQKLEGEAEDPFVEYYWEGTVFRKFYAAAFSLGGEHLVTAGTGGIWYYDTDKKRLLQQYMGNNSRKISISPNGQWILASLYEQIQPISVYDLQSGEILFSLDDNGRGIAHPQSVFSPDGRLVGTALATWDGPYKIVVYDTVTGQEYKSLLMGEGIDLTSLAFNPQANLIAVGQADGKILLVEMETMEVLATLSGHHGAVEHLVFSVDGIYLSSGGYDGTVRAWGLP